MADSLHWFNGSGRFGPSRTLLLDDDATLQRVFLKNESETATIAVGLGGVPATLREAGSVTLGPGGWISEDCAEPGRITLVASDADTPVTFKFANTSGQHPGAGAAADALLRRYASPDTLSAEWKAAIRTLYISLYNIGFVQNAVGLHVLVGPDSTSIRLNWAAEDSGLTGPTPPTFVRGQGVDFDGATQYFDTGLALRDSRKVSITNIAQLVGADGIVVNTPSHPAASDGTVGVVPNRTATSFGIYAVSGTGDSIAVAGTGGMVGFARVDTLGYTAYRNKEIAVRVTRAPNSSFTDYTMLLGARNSATGPVEGTFFRGRLHWHYVGPAPSPAQKDAVFDAFETYRAAVGNLP
ncbi:hypothetical protein KXR53_22465 [Inquilinus limosus]|uniref:hypothetical protein n=1 Tax=Inquilinus limosus TaxID=171674 RepID=UPI003F16D553